MSARTELLAEKVKALLGNRITGVVDALGEVTVTVVEVFPNGNLFVRGEKQLALTGSAETIQVSGIVRPEDIGRNNKVYSRRMANALISYTGTGEVSNAGKVGWGTNLLMKLWPF